MNFTAEAILTSNFQPFLHALSQPPPQSSDVPEDVSPAVLGALIERLVLDPPRNWGEEPRESFHYALRMRYNRIATRVPQPVESAMFLIELMDSQDIKLAKHVQKIGPRGTSSLDACKEMLTGVETR